MIEPAYQTDCSSSKGDNILSFINKITHIQYQLDYF